MIIATAGNNIFFGLSERNLQLLREGKPIKVALADIGFKGDVYIYYGPTERAMRDDLLGMVGPDTVVQDKLKRTCDGKEID